MTGSQLGESISVRLGQQLFSWPLGLLEGDEDDPGELCTLLESR